MPGGGVVSDVAADEKGEAFDDGANGLGLGVQFLGGGIALLGTGGVCLGDMVQLGDGLAGLVHAAAVLILGDRLFVGLERGGNSPSEILVFLLQLSHPVFAGGGHVFPAIGTVLTHRAAGEGRDDRIGGLNIVESNSGKHGG